MAGALIIGATDRTTDIRDMTNRFLQIAKKSKLHLMGHPSRRPVIQEHGPVKVRRLKNVKHLVFLFLHIYPAPS